nr:hypothetical protein GCM10020092_018400 [Actinoplanes digitatis]
MTATPIRCHQALTSESSRTRLTPNVFSRPCTRMMIRKITKVRALVTSMSKVRLRNAAVVMAAPKSMAAVTATSPRKLNQPMNQAQAALFFLASAAAHQ